MTKVHLLYALVNGEYVSADSAEELEADDAIFTSLQEAEQLYNQYF